MTTRDKFMTTRRELAAALIERDEEIDLVLTALVAKEHALLVGPPGCAKSLLLDSLMKWAGGSKFAALLNKYTVPEEIMGPVSVAGLKADSRRGAVGRPPGTAGRLCPRDREGSQPGWDAGELGAHRNRADSNRDGLPEARPGREGRGAAGRDRPRAIWHRWR